MKIVTGEEALMLSSALMGYTPSLVASCIACYRDNEIVASVIYDGYNDQSMHIQIFLVGVPCKEWVAMILDYPFNKVGIKKLLAGVNSNNKRCRKMIEHVGFRVEGVIKNFYQDGDLLLYTLVKEECVLFADPKWSRVLEAINAD